MTKQAEAATAPETGRRNEPIEITPEMIEAGVVAAALFDSRDSLETIAVAIYQAMRPLEPR